ncbi:MAG: phosphohistidine phosphatase SixA [Spirochaetia bacterium]|nr:phosphohistidine phosphatase SixA [Spirochaetota bacterium]MCX8096741.1 phosphohistidine phosphatase SixA [Spirochaetota bacterium]MDW8112152.1 phosphohistidine phosphatase SixA [Spirochaetia bacterium]
MSSVSRLIFLVQHGEAKSEDEDPERHLKDIGKEKTRKVADILYGMSLRPRVIVHSGKARARETAEIMAEVLKPEKGIVEEKGLSPLDDPSSWARRLESEQGVMIVGHLPYLSKLTSLLLIGNQDVEIVKFTYSSCLVIVKEEKFRISLFITPEV